MSAQDVVSPGVDVDQRVVRLVRLVGPRRPGVPFQRAEVGRPDQRGRLVHHQVGAGLAGLRGRVGPARQPVWRVVGELLVPEPGGARPAREAVHVQRPVGQVGQRGRGDLRGVPDQLPLGHRRRTVARREQLLVQVGQLELAPEHGPAAAVAERVQAGQFLRVRPGRLRRAEPHRGLGGGQVGPPHPLRVGLDLVVGPPAEHRGRVVLRVPAFDGVLVVLVQQQPLVAVPADQDEPAAQLLAEQVGVEVAGPHRGRRVVGGVRGPGAPVPDDHVAAAVLAVRDDPLEVQVLDGVILDVHRGAPHVRVQRGAPRHSPADQHPIDLETQVVVQPPGPVPLHHEPRGAVRRPGRPGLPGRLRCPAEVALALITGQFPGHPAPPVTGWDLPGWAGLPHARQSAALGTPGRWVA